MPKADIAHAVQQLVKAKQSLTAKERSLIARLNAGLRKMGYQVVSLTQGGVKRASASMGKRRGMSAAARKAISQRMKAYWAKRRRQRTKSN